MTVFSFLFSSFPPPLSAADLPQKCRNMCHIFPHAPSLPPLFFSIFQACSEEEGEKTEGKGRGTPLPPYANERQKGRGRKKKTFLPLSYFTMGRRKRRRGLLLLPTRTWQLALLFTATAAAGKKEDRRKERHPMSGLINREMTFPIFSLWGENDVCA